MILRNDAEKEGVSDSKPVRKPSMAMGLAVAGLMSVSGCAATRPQSIGTISVLEHLRSTPEDSSERLNEPGSLAALTGTVADCKGVHPCTVPLTPGSIFMNVRFAPEYGGNMEVVVDQVTLTGVVFTKTTSYSLGSPEYESQTLEFGAGRRLFQTDLAVRVEMGQSGAFAVIE